MQIKILSNMKSSIYIDDKFVGEVGANKLFTYTVTQTGDYYIKLVEKCTSRNYHLTKIANIKDSVLLQFDFAEVLLEHQECLSFYASVDRCTPENDLFFKRKKSNIEVWSSEYGIRLSEIENVYDEIIPFDYHYESKEYLLLAYSGKKCYILNLYGKIHIEISNGDIWKCAGKLKSGIYKHEGKFGLFEEFGKVLLPAEFSECNDVQYGGAAILSSSDKHVLMRMNDGAILELDCDKIELDFEELYTKISKGDKKGIISDGKMLACLYDDIETIEIRYYDDHSGETYIPYFKLNINGKYGLADYKCNIIVECKYEDIYEIGDRYFIAEDNDLHTLLNLRGEKVLCSSYPGIITPQDYSECISEIKNTEDSDESMVPDDIKSRYLILLGDSEKYLFDTYTNKIIQGDYDKFEFESFHKYNVGYDRFYSYVLAYNNDNVSLIVDGKLILDNVDDIWYVYPECAETVNLFVFKINHNIGIVDCSGKIIIPPDQDEVRIESAKLEDGCDYVFYVWKNDICHCYDKIGRFIKKYPKNLKIEKLRYFDDALTAYHEMFESWGDEICGAGWNMSGSLWNTEID